MAWPNRKIGLVLVCDGRRWCATNDLGPGNVGASEAAAGCVVYGVAWQVGRNCPLLHVELPECEHLGVVDFEYAGTPGVQGDVDELVLKYLGPCGQVEVSENALRGNGAEFLRDCIPAYGDLSLVEEGDEDLSLLIDGSGVPGFLANDSAQVSHATK